RLTGELAPWRELHGDQLCLGLGDQQFPAFLVTCRPEDIAIGAARWVQFHLDAKARRLLENFRLPARLRAILPEYQHESGPLGAEVRQSLLDDLGLSDRD